jgi:hypothetical protein
MNESGGTLPTTGVWLPTPGEGQETMFLENCTSVDLGYNEERPWSLSPLAYQGSGCWSEGSGDYMLNGLASSALMSAGIALLVVSLGVKILEKTVGTCCGRPIKPVPAEPASAAHAQILGVQEPPKIEAMAEP